MPQPTEKLSPITLFKNLQNEVLHKLNKYEIKRDRRYCVRNLFYTDHAHVERINAMKNDIQTLFKMMDKKSSEKIKFSDNFGYISIHDRAKYDEYILPEYRSHNTLRDFPVAIHFPKKTEAEAKAFINSDPDACKIFLFWRLVMEYDYAGKNNSLNYKATLADIARLCLPLFTETATQSNYDGLIKKVRERKLQLMADKKKWDLCFVWDGRIPSQTFRPWYCETPKEANREYHGYEAREEYMYFNNMSQFGGTQLRTQTVVLSYPSELRFFYPHREYVEESENLMTLLKKFMDEVLKCKIEEKNNPCFKN